jgi:hypothetical protein
MSDVTGAADVNDDSGVVVTGGTYVTVRIDLTDPAQPRVWINNTGGAIAPSNEIDPSLITGAIGAAVAVAPFLLVQNLAGVITRNLAIDYFKVWQDRG